MAVTNESLLVDIQINTEKSSKGVETLTKQLEDLNLILAANTRNSQKTSQSVTGFGAAMVKLNAVVAVAQQVYSALSGAVKASVGEYMEAEKAQVRMGLSLAALGQYTEENVKDFQAFATEMEQTLGVSDELALSLLTSAKNMGLSNEQAKKMVNTAADLAAVTGKDLQESFNGLAGTLKGQTRGLGEMGKQLQGMSDEALKSGQAIEVLSKQIGGTAKGAMDSFGGSVKIMEASMSALTETFGDVLVNSFNLRGATDYLVTVFKALKNLLEQNKPVFDSIGKSVEWLVDKFVTLVSIIELGVIGNFQLLIGIFTQVGAWAAKVASAIGFISEDKAKALQDFSTAMIDAGKVNWQGAKEGGKALMGLGQSAEIASKKAKGLKDTLNDLNNKAKGQGKPSIGFSDEQLKFLEELKKKNAEIESQLKQQDMLQQDRIQEQLRLQKEVLNLKLQELKLNGQNISEVEKHLALLDKQAAKAGEKAPSRAFEGAEKPLKDAAETISRSVTGGLDGVAGQVTGMMSGAGAVMGAVNGVLDFVQQIIDFIPQILEKMANIFNSLTELPSKIADGVENLVKALTNFVANFIPNLLKAIPRILEAVVDAFANLPDIFLEMVNSLPDLILKIIDKIPELVQKFVTALVSNADVIAIGLIDAVIRNLPKLAMAFMKMIWIEIPKAIIKGIIDGVKKIGEAIKRLFSGKGIADDFVKSIGKSFKSIGKSLTGASSQLFNVSDLQDGLAAAGDPIKQAVESVTEELWSWLDALKKVWKWILDALKKIWTWIWEKILQPMIEALRTLWLWVYDNIINPIIEGLRTVWLWVYETIIAPMLSGLQSVWNFVLFSVINPLVSAIRSVWVWVQTNIFNPIIDAFRGIADYFGGILNGANLNFGSTFSSIGNMFNGIGNWFTNIAGSFSGISNAFNGIANFLRDYIVNPLQAGFGWIGALGATIGKIFETPPWLQGLIDAANALGGGGDFNPFNKGGPVYAASGMMIPKGTDTVPAMLTPGEFVVNRGAVNALGMGAMNQINNGQLPNSGGTNVNVSMNITTTEPVDENFVRSKLMPRIKEEMRRASLDGAFMMSGRGIRTT